MSEAEKTLSGANPVVAGQNEERVERETAVFRVFIEGTMDQVWRELTKTDEVQQAMFNSRMHTPGLEPGAPLHMRSPDGKFTAVVGRVIELDHPVKFSHTFRFTAYDDPECTVVYELQQKPGGVDFTLTVEDLPVGTRSGKQMASGGRFITKTLKSIVETGRPTMGARMLFVLFKLLAPLNPKRTRTEQWPL